jgi:hypothetical protein
MIIILSFHGKFRLPGHSFINAGLEWVLNLQVFVTQACRYRIMIPTRRMNTHFTQSMCLDLKGIRARPPARIAPTGINHRIGAYDAISNAPSPYTVGLLNTPKKRTGPQSWAEGKIKNPAGKTKVVETTILFVIDSGMNGFIFPLFSDPSLYIFSVYFLTSIGPNAPSFAVSPVSVRRAHTR